MSSTRQPNQNTHMMSTRPVPFNTVWKGQRSFKHLHVCLWLTKRRGEQRGGVAGRLWRLTVGNFKELLQ